MDTSQTRCFQKNKHIVDRNTLLTYPYFNEEFEVHTNDRAFQLGAVIIHKVKPINLYSIKITSSHKRYTVHR